MRTAIYGAVFLPLLVALVTVIALVGDFRVDEHLDVFALAFFTGAAAVLLWQIAGDIARSWGLS